MDAGLTGHSLMVTELAVPPACLWGPVGVCASGEVLPGEKRLTVLPQADSWHRRVTLVIFHKKVPSKEASSMRCRLCSSLPRAWSFWASVCCNSTTCGEAPFSHLCSLAYLSSPDLAWGGARKVGSAPSTPPSGTRLCLCLCCPSCLEFLFLPSPLANSYLSVRNLAPLPSLWKAFNHRPSPAGLSPALTYVLTEPL